MAEYTPLDSEEQELMESVRHDEWKPAEMRDELLSQAKEYAAATLKKDKRMNIRIAERDLQSLKVRALEEGLPYQTLVSMILHKYVTGQLTERTAQGS